MPGDTLESGGVPIREVLLTQDQYEQMLSAHVAFVEREPAA